MNKIKNTLRISEVDTLATTIVRFYQMAILENEALAKDAKLTKQMSEVEELSKTLTSAIKRDRAENNLDAADITRDEIIRSLSYMIKSYASFPVTEKKEAGCRLLEIFKKYGIGIISEPYADESSLIESMLGDFSSERAKADLAILEEVGTLLSSLRKAQDAFHAADDVYTASVANRGANASEVKKKLLFALNTRLISYLTALELDADYAEFIANCSTRIDRSNSGTRGKGAGETADAEGASAESAAESESLEA